MYKRIFNLNQKDKRSVIIFGPRGTGKTQWLKSNFKQALYFDLLSSEVYTELLGNPSILEARIPSGYDDVVIIDEIQKIPDLLNEVHRLIESKNIQFILTGSSARSLRKKGVNLLAGRALTYHMHPFIADELKEDFDLNNALKSGLLPMAYTSESYNHYLKSYIETYLKEEVMQEALTRNIPLFARFLATAAFSQGEVLNYTSIAREIGTNRQSVSNFFDILEDLLIAIRIPVFNKRAKRDLVAHSKFYYFDVGVYTAIRPKGPLDSADELHGPALETFFLQHVRAINDYYHLGYEFFYWRTKSGIEVDFVVYGENGFFAFEVKNTKRLTKKDFKGLKVFKDDYPAAKVYMLYRGEREYFDGDVSVLPIDRMILQLKKIFSTNP